MQNRAKFGKRLPQIVAKFREVAKAAKHEKFANICKLKTPANFSTFSQIIKPFMPPSPTL
jgi:hypothetical protein